jgi:hypothetical protein
MGFIIYFAVLMAFAVGTGAGESVTEKYFAPLEESVACEEWPAELVSTGGATAIKRGPGMPDAHSTKLLKDLLVEKRYGAFMMAARKCADKYKADFGSQPDKKPIPEPIFTETNYENLSQSELVALGPHVASIVDIILRYVKQGSTEALAQKLLNAYLRFHAVAYGGRFNQLAVVLIDGAGPGLSIVREELLRVTDGSNYKWLRRLVKPPSTTLLQEFYKELLQNSTIKYLQALIDNKNTRNASLYVGVVGVGFTEDPHVQDGRTLITNDDKIEFMKRLRGMNRPNILARYLLWDHKASSTDVESPASLSIKGVDIGTLDAVKDQYLIAEIFDSLMTVFGELGYAGAIIGRYKTPFCMSLQDKDNLTKFFLLLSMHPIQEDAHKMREYYQQECDSNAQITFIKSTKELLEGTRPNKKVVSFLKDRSHFNFDDFEIRLELANIKEKLEIIKGGVTLWGISDNAIEKFSSVKRAFEFSEDSFETIAKTIFGKPRKEILDVLDHLLSIHRELRKALEKILTVARSKVKPKKEKSEEERIAFIRAGREVEKWEKIQEDVQFRIKHQIDAFMSTPAIQDSLNIPFFYDIVRVALFRDDAAFFELLCKGDKCKDLPMELIKSYRESVLFIEEGEFEAINAGGKSAEDERKIREDAGIAIRKEVAKYLQLFEVLNRQLRRQYKVIDPTKPSGGGKAEAASTEVEVTGSAPPKVDLSEIRNRKRRPSRAAPSAGAADIPGLNDSVSLPKDFNLDYLQAINLTDTRGLRFLRQAFAPWHSREYYKTTNEDLLSELLLYAISESKLLLVHDIFARKVPPKPTFQHTLGFRVFVAYVIHTLAGAQLKLEDVSLKAVSLTHLGITIDSISDCSGAKVVEGYNCAEDLLHTACAAVGCPVMRGSKLSPAPVVDPLIADPPEDPPMKPAKYGFAESWLLDIYHLFIREQAYSKLPMEKDQQRRFMGPASGANVLGNDLIADTLLFYEALAVKYLGFDREASRELFVWMQSRLPRNKVEER